MHELLKEEHWHYIEAAINAARSSMCYRSRCGSVIVNDGHIIASGYNSPPANLLSQCRCGNNKDVYHKKVTDKTCCVHAEQRAMFAALATVPHELSGATLYFIRLDDKDQPQPAGNPYCTICSKMALDLGIAQFVLWHEHGLVAYDTDEYNSLSYLYQ